MFRIWGFWVQGVWDLGFRDLGCGLGAWVEGYL